MGSNYINYAQVNSLEENTFIAGTDFVEVFEIYDQNGLPVDLGGGTAKIVLSPYGQFGYNILQISGVISGTNNNIITVEYLTAQTKDLSGKYIRQLVINSFGGKEYRPAQGTLLISPQTPIV